jgi:hypothetical protein
MPTHLISQSKEKMFNVLMTVLQNTDDKTLKTPIVDNMMSFISSAEQVTLARSWADKK